MINKELVKSVVSVLLNVIGVSCLVTIIIVSYLSDNSHQNDHHLLIMFVLICAAIAKMYLCLPTSFSNNYYRRLHSSCKEFNSTFTILLQRHYGPRTLGTIVAEQLNAAAEERLAENSPSIEDPNDVSDVPAQHWNHEVHAMGAAFGFTAPFLPRLEQ